jgi:hypothetical protein
MSIIPTQANNLLRDTTSKAILVTDDIAREEFRKRVNKQKNAFDSLKNDIEQLQNSMNDINTIKEEIREIRELLLCICRNKEQ